MQISAVIEYTASPQEVFAMLTDEAFQTRKCVATGAHRHTVSVEAKGDRTMIVSTRDMPTDNFPPFVRKMVGAELTVTETQDWGPADTDGARQGLLTVDIIGSPIDLAGTLALAPGAQGTLETIKGDLKASIPFLGNKVEHAAAPAIQSAIRVEGETGSDWLATRK